MQHDSEIQENQVKLMFKILKKPQNCNKSTRITFDGMKGKIGGLTQLPL